MFIPVRPGIGGGGAEGVAPPVVVDDVVVVVLEELAEVVPVVPLFLCLSPLLLLSLPMIWVEMLLTVTESGPTSTYTYGLLPVPDRKPGGRGPIDPVDEGGTCRGQSSHNHFNIQHWIFTILSFFKL